MITRSDMCIDSPHFENEIDKLTMEFMQIRSSMTDDEALEVEMMLVDLRTKNLEKMG